MDRVTDPSDPRRCKAADHVGQCWNVAEAGPFCTKCASGGRRSVTAEKRRIYNLTKARYRERFERKLLDGEPEHNFDEEIRLTEILLEEIWNSDKIDDPVVLAREHKLLSETLDRLKRSSYQFKEKSNQLLGRPAVILISQQIIHLLIDELQGVPGFEDKIDRITGRMLDVIEHATNTPEDSNGVPNQTG